MAVHSRPAAFEGRDGMSYSVEILADQTGDVARPWGGYLLFLRWRRYGEAAVEGHLESDFLAHGASEMEARDAVGRMSLHEAKDVLDALVRRDYGGAPTRRWWDVMRDEGEGDLSREDSTHTPEDHAGGHPGAHGERDDDGCES